MHPPLQLLFGCEWHGHTRRPHMALGWTEWIKPTALWLA